MEFTSDQITQIIVALVGGSSIITVILGHIKAKTAARQVAADESNKKFKELSREVTTLASTIQALHSYHQQTEANTNYIIEGLILSLRSEQIIFQALRNHKINGESEKMDLEINKYLLGQTKHALHSFEDTTQIYSEKISKIKEINK